MKMSEIKKRYHNQWLLIEVKKFDKNYNIIEGKVTLSSPLKDDIYRALLKNRGKKVAIDYVGDLPKEMAVLL
jgi:hypothetical protein